MTFVISKSWNHHISLQLMSRTNKINFYQNNKWVRMSYYTLLLIFFQAHFVPIKCVIYTFKSFNCFFLNFLHLILFHFFALISCKRKMKASPMYTHFYISSPKSRFYYICTFWWNKIDAVLKYLRYCRRNWNRRRKSRIIKIVLYRFVNINWIIFYFRIWIGSNL